jgi:hypothetical protein
MPGTRPSMLSALSDVVCMTRGGASRARDEIGLPAPSGLGA